MAVGPASIYDISATRKRFDVNKQIAQLVPDASPFAVFMMRARKKVVDSEKFYWYDEEPAPWWTSHPVRVRGLKLELLRSIPATWSRAPCGCVG